MPDKFIISLWTAEAIAEDNGIDPEEFNKLLRKSHWFIYDPKTGEEVKDS